MLEKKKRIIDDDALERFRGQPCVICRRPSDPCHVRSRGAGGDDMEWNLVALCRRHHIDQHKMGWRRFVDKNPEVGVHLEIKGWRFDDRGRLWHDKE